MDLIAIESFAVTTGIPALSLVLNAYVSLRKSNVELYFDKLLKSKHDFSIMHDREDLQRYFLQFIEKVSLEANVEKIEKWKNVIIHITSDFKDYSFKDNFITSLESLSVFDLTVLHIIYHEDKQNVYDVHFARKKIIEKLKVDPPMVLHTYKKLVSLNFLDENIKGSADGGDVVMYSEEFGNVENAGVSIDVSYKRNTLGEDFLKFISDVSQI